MKTTISVIVFILLVIGCETANWLFFQLNPIAKTSLALNAVNGSMVDSTAARAYSADAEAIVRGGLFLLYVFAGYLILVLNKPKSNKNETCSCNN